MSDNSACNCEQSKQLEVELADANEKIRVTDTLAQIRQALYEFYTPEQTDEWLDTPQQCLQGAVPRNLVVEHREVEVFAVIEQLTTGAFV